MALKDCLIEGDRSQTKDTPSSARARRPLPPSPNKSLRDGTCFIRCGCAHDSFQVFYCRHDIGTLELSRTKPSHALSVEERQTLGGGGPRATAFSLPWGRAGAMPPRWHSLNPKGRIDFTEAL